MQKQWAEYIDKRDHDQQKLDAERRRQDMEALPKVEQQQQEHSQNMQQQQQLEFMACLYSKYGL